MADLNGSLVQTVTSSSVTHRLHVADLLRAGDCIDRKRKSTKARRCLVCHDISVDRLSPLLRVDCPTSFSLDAPELASVDMTDVAGDNPIEPIT
jgi:hypothetical protein